MADYSIFDLQVIDTVTGRSIFASGGKAIVTLAGAYTNATLLNPDNNFAALSQPVSLTRGKLRFAVSTGGAGQTTQPAVDIYGTAPGGQAFQLYNVVASTLQEIRIDTLQLDQTMVVPFSYATGADGAERDSGLDFPTGALVSPWVWADVKAIDATETLDIGLLASESGGDANGFAALLDVGTAGVTRVKWAPTATAGALLQESNATTPAVLTPYYAEIAAAVSLSWTLTAGADTGNGRIGVPYKIGVLG